MPCAQRLSVVEHAGFHGPLRIGVLLVKRHLLVGQLALHILSRAQGLCSQVGL
jgi:hypothetical protein